MIALRSAGPGDAAAITGVYAPHVEHGTVSFETLAPSPATIAERIAAGGGLYPWLVAEEDATLLGYAYASQFSARDAYRWTVETTIYLDAAAQRRGVGRRLYAALLATLSAQGFTQAVGRIALPNPASAALHTALGFRETGVLEWVGWKAGRWVDVGYWQRALAEGSDGPAPPRAFSVIVEP